MELYKVPVAVLAVVVAMIAVALDDCVHHQPLALGSKVSSKNIGLFAPMFEVEEMTIVVVPLPAMLLIFSGLVVK